MIVNERVERGPKEEPASLAELWRTGRIVSWWQMDEYFTHRLWDLSRRLEREWWMVKSGSTKSILDREKELRHIHFEFMKLGLRSAQKQTERMLNAYFTPPKESLTDSEKDNYTNMVDELARRIEDELSDRKSLVLRPEDIEYFDSNQFDAESQAVFEKCIPDMIEAGRCFALERYPACVFHLTRIYSAGVSKLHDFFGGASKTRNAGDLIKALKQVLSEGKHGKKPEQERMAADLIETLVSFKDSPRNPLSHSDEELAEDSIRRIASFYTKEEAARHFLNVKGLTQKITAIIS